MKTDAQQVATTAVLAARRGATVGVVVLTGLFGLSACGAGDAESPDLMVPAGALGTGAAGANGSETDSLSAGAATGTGATGTGTPGAPSTDSSTLTGATPGTGSMAAAGDTLDGSTTADPASNPASQGSDPGAGGGAAPTDGAADPGMMGASPSVTSRPVGTDLMFDVTTENPMVEPYFQIYRPTDMDAAIAATGGPLPIVVWASGGCVRADFAWAPMLERWAAAGYFVLGLTPGPDASVSGTTTDKEHGELIDWAYEQTDFPDMLDLERVVATGNSCGGVTALQTTSKDDRVTSVFVLSGSSAIGSADTAVMAGVKVPLGFVVGNEREDIAAGPAKMDYDLLGDGIPGMIVNRTTGDHFTVSTDAAVLPEDAEIALNWMDLTLYGIPEAAAALESDNVCNSCTPGDWKLTKKNWESLLP